MKILYVTTVSCTMNFFKSFIGELVKGGHTVELACNCDEPVNDYYIQLGCKIHNIRFSRNPMSPVNLKAYKELRALIKQEKYDIVHCHTPVASVYTRLACIGERKKGTKVFYTAHGFHFYKGAPLLNWLVYYPAEKVCAYFTDVLITINKEDYALAQKKMKAKRVEYVPGVGIDVEGFSRVWVEANEKTEFFKENGIPFDAKIIASVGELNANKNHSTVLNAISLLENINVHYVIAGAGDKHDYLRNLAKNLGIEERVHLLGYRNDIARIYKMSDICCMPSIREGQGLAAIEGMACGLPIVVSNNRGLRDVCKDGVNGFMCSPLSPHEFSDALSKLLGDEALCARMSAENIVAAKKYDISLINQLMLKIYLG